MYIEYMNKVQASDQFTKLIETNYEQTVKLSEEYQKLRDILIQKNDTIRKSIDAHVESNRRSYIYDVKFGLAVYEATNKIFNLKSNYAIASNEGFWIYINMVVIPDLVFDRWKDSENKKIRFYEHTKRIYTNALWWYIHLGWQRNYNDTLESLSIFTTDTIVQLIERSGDGYNLELSREIIKQLYENRNTSANYFRKIMKLNTIYIKTIQPEFYINGIQGYVEMIFKKVEK